VIALDGCRGELILAEEKKGKNGLKQNRPWKINSGEAVGKTGGRAGLWTEIKKKKGRRFSRPQTALTKKGKLVLRRSRLRPGGNPAKTICPWGAGG